MPPPPNPILTSLKLVASISNSQHKHVYTIGKRPNEHTDGHASERTSERAAKIASEHARKRNANETRTTRERNANETRMNT